MDALIFLVSMTIIIFITFAIIFFMFYYNYRSNKKMEESIKAAARKLAGHDPGSALFYTVSRKVNARKWFDFLYLVAPRREQWPQPLISRALVAMANGHVEGGGTLGVGWVTLLEMVADGKLPVEAIESISRQQYEKGMPMWFIESYHGPTLMITESQRGDKKIVEMKYSGIDGDTFIFEDSQLIEWKIRKMVWERR